MEKSETAKERPKNKGLMPFSWSYGELWGSMENLAGWCPRRGSNPYTLRLRILSPLRLPISSLGRALESGLYRTVPAFGLFDTIDTQKGAFAGLWIARTS